MSAARESVLTLEPLIDAVRDGVEATGWALSGLQKTTSHEYAGRWEGRKLEERVPLSSTGRASPRP